MNDADVGPGLLAYLRRALAQDRLEFTEAPAPITGGYNTRIYGFRVAPTPPKFDRSLVLRLYPQPRYAMHAVSEFVRQRFVYERGYPVPEPLLVEQDSGVFGGPFLVMEHMPHRPMIDKLLVPGTYLWRAPTLMAQAQVRLHRLPVDGFPGYVPGGHLTQELDTLRSRTERGGYEGTSAVLDWLERNRPEVREEAVCHIDFHPLNLLVDKGGEITAVVDWENSAVADSHRDVAQTLVILRTAPVRGSLLERAIVAVGRGVVARLFLRAYRRLRPVDPELLRYYETMGATRWLLEALEWREAAAGRIEGRADRADQATDTALRGWADYIEVRSGVRLLIP